MKRSSQIHSLLSLAMENNSLNLLNKAAFHIFRFPIKELLHLHDNAYPAHNSIMEYRKIGVWLQISLCRPLLIHSDRSIDRLIDRLK